ncbi:E3 ubiquitin-protein ligase RHA1B [Apostasia shenzhenica]|uniref:E3 ubiquitin-protein ligase RHA1B n=1 Tax=Apostasia shenzhenica TaxID=1088818 RepID=A0A2I0AKK7_9ASPA|nr:E3 ubiquitin-protein ligase RHA1B [Apostasia shenzhenica]
MGFPVGYSELLFPKLLLQVVFFLGFLRRIISAVFNAVGLGDLLDSDAPWPDSPGQIRDFRHQPPENHSVSAMLIQEILPVVRFGDLVADEGEIERRPVADGCAVCLYEFEDREEVRPLSNCRHVFHRCCLDRWMEHDQRTCPLCRTPLVPEEMQEAFNLRLWAAAGVPDDFVSDPDYFPFPPPSPSHILPPPVLSQ